jgi:hypothetical protein
VLFSGLKAIISMFTSPPGLKCEIAVLRQVDRYPTFRCAPPPADDAFRRNDQKLPFQIQ